MLLTPGHAPRVRAPCVALVAAAAHALGRRRPAPPRQPPEAQFDAACMECHSDTDLSMKKAGKKLSLFVDEKVVNSSAHRTLNCIDCHEDFDGEASPHKKKIEPVDCFSCHEDTGKKHAFHPRLLAKEIPKGEDTDCKSCHGTHNVAEKSRALPLPTPAAQACGQCHEKARDHFAAPPTAAPSPRSNPTPPTA